MTSQPTLTARADRRLIRAGARSDRFLLVELTAPTAAPDPGRRRPPVNLAFVVDRSGSMSGRGKLDLAKRALEEALARLEPDDRFSLVVYDDHVDVVAASASATAVARTLAAATLHAVEPRGSTNLGGGWLAGCEQVAAQLMADGVNRCLLLTDGLANVGMTDPGDLAHHAGELRARGVSTTTFGVGEDFDESLLQAMSDAGGGHFYFIGDLPQIRDHITGEVGEALEVVARGVVLEVTAPEPVAVESLTPLRTERRGSRTLLHVGDLVSGQLLRIVLRLAFPPGEVGQEVGALLAIGDRDGAMDRPEPVGVGWTYAEHAANDEQARDREVDRAVAEVFAARARQEAVALNRRGDFVAAQQALASVARRIEGYAGSDPRLRELVRGLDGEAAAMQAPMPEMARKQMHFAASAVMRTRTASGQAMKRPPS